MVSSLVIEIHPMEHHSGPGYRHCSTTDITCWNAFGVTDRSVSYMLGAVFDEINDISILKREHLTR